MEEPVNKAFKDIENRIEDYVKKFVEIGKIAEDFAKDIEGIENSVTILVFIDCISVDKFSTLVLFSVLFSFLNYRSTQSTLSVLFFIIAYFMYCGFVVFNY